MNLNKDFLDQISRDEIISAGPRYTPQIEDGAPNLVIEQVMNALNAIAFNKSAIQTIDNFIGSINDVWKDSPVEVKNYFKSNKQNPKYIARLLQTIKESEPGQISSELSKLTRGLNFISQKLSNKRHELILSERNSNPSSSKSNDQYLRVHTDKVLSEINALISYFNTPTPYLLKSNLAVILGEWGTGKTHTLADFTNLRINSDAISLFLLAQHIPPGNDTLNQICHKFNLECNKTELLQFLQSKGEEVKKRSLIIIDGINEGDRNSWSNSLVPLAEELTNYPNVGLILSCRTPYNNQMFTSKAESLYEKINHPGFLENEIDAQQEFFRHYDIPTPQIPLLNPEFSRPLFLKLFCEAVKERSKSTKRRKLKEVATGQKGMTYLLEYFVKNISDSIEEEFNLRKKAVWRIIKGDKVGKNTLFWGIAPTMAINDREYVYHQECIDAIKNLTHIQSDETAQNLLQEMILEGLLMEDLIYDDGDYVDIIKLPYQRFSDHLIARHLLRSFLNTDSVESIKRSFYKDRKLGKLFITSVYNDSYRRSGLVSAIMLEFPERVKRKLPNNERELINYIPKKRRYLTPLAEAFQESLIWRSNDTITVQTEGLLKLILAKSDKYLHKRLLETIVTVATRTSHRFNAKWLLQYLENFSMTERDITWSEYLRSVSEESSVLRLLDWIETVSIKKLDEDTVSNLLLLLSLMLTTTHRKRRDRVTHAIYRLGFEYPNQIFSITINSLKFNDPYVPERLLAASYGVAMKSWCNSNRRIFHNTFVSFAKQLYQNFFAPTSKYSTHHVLIKDYSIRIIEIARKLDRYCIANQYVKFIKPPHNHFQSPFPNANTISVAKVAAANRAIHMDFENYTIGRLVSDRRNYDMNHNDYQDVLNLIKWRILDLGYDFKKFESVDQFIDRMNFNRAGKSSNGSKVDRYGKKYSWIAFFEMYGLRKDLGLLEDYRDEEGLSVRDIDPSFPDKLPEWHPNLPEIFTQSPKPHADWLKSNIVPHYDHLLIIEMINSKPGPWVLLNGYINQKSNDKREVFTFLRGLFIHPEVEAIAREKLENIQYPGNFKIPDPTEDHYTYVGEVPWSCQFASFLKNNNCSPKRDVREVLYENQTEIIKKRIDELTPKELLQTTAQIDIQQIIQNLGSEKTTKSSDDLPDFVNVSKTKKIPGIKAEIPISEVHDSFGSEINQYGTFKYPTPAICEALNLIGKGSTSCLFDKNESIATLQFNNEDEASNKVDLIYLRKDLLDKYLSHTVQTLIWINWGERTLHHEVINNADRESEIHSIRGSYDNIHKNLISYAEIRS